MDSRQHAVLDSWRHARCCCAPHVYFVLIFLAGSPPVAVPFASSCVGAREACQRHTSSTVMVAVGHAKDAVTFTYVNFLYAFDSSPPHALLGWVPLNLGARVTMGMCVGCGAGGSPVWSRHRVLTCLFSGVCSRWTVVARCFCPMATVIRACVWLFMTPACPCKPCCGCNKPESHSSR